MLQNALRDRLGFIGSLLGGLLEVAWAAITYFVVPVLVVDGVGPIEAIKRSSAILKRTWGEAVAGEGGLGIIALPADAAGVPRARHRTSTAAAQTPPLPWRSCCPSSSSTS